MFPLVACLFFIDAFVPHAHWSHWDVLLILDYYCFDGDGMINDCALPAYTKNTTGTRSVKIVQYLTAWRALIEHCRRLTTHYLYRGHAQPIHDLQRQKASLGLISDVDSMKLCFV